MKHKLILLLGILLVVSLVRADLASDLEALGEDMPFGWESVWKDNCQTRCIDGKCNTILGRTIWVNDSDGICKPIEQVKSLKNGFFIEYLEIDPSFNLTASEFNISYMDMTLNFEGNPTDYPTFCQVTDELNAKCDFKLDEKWDEIIDNETGETVEKSQLKFQYKWELKQGIVTKGDKVKYEYKENVMGKKFSFGGNSTTIQLQDANTENLDDAWIALGDATNEKGGDDEFGLDSSISPENFMIKFNILAIPGGQQIDSAQLAVKINSEQLDTGEAIYAHIHHVYSFPFFNVSGDADGKEWTEGTGTSYNTAVAPELCWNWRPTTSDEYNTTAEDTLLYSNGDGTIWLIWNVTNMVSKTYNDGDSNISMMGTATDAEGNPGTADDLDIDSKEEGVTTVRPYLNITYSEAPAPEDTCTCPASGNWLVQCSDNCDIQACDMQTNNVLINGTGTAQSLRNITNATRIRLQEGCTVRW